MEDYELGGFTCDHLTECHTADSLFFEGTVVVSLDVDEQVDVGGLGEGTAEALRGRRQHQRRVRALQRGMSGRCISICDHDCREVEITGVGIAVFRPREPKKDGKKCEAPNLLR